jgi:hypothetical protein
MMMFWRAIVAGLLLAMTVLAPAARACSPMPAEPSLDGESDAAYRARTAALLQQRQAQWLKERQSDDLQRAKVIFIARDTDWSPSQKPRYRNGRLLPPVLIPVPPVPKINFPAPSYFKPIDWFLGPRSTRLFKVGRDNTSCGPMSLGDTTSSKTGDLFVFFAKSWPATGDSLIDAIELDRINDPALENFVARYRHNSPPVERL